MKTTLTTHLPLLIATSLLAAPAIVQGETPSSEPPASTQPAAETPEAALQALVGRLKELPRQPAPDAAPEAVEAWKKSFAKGAAELADAAHAHLTRFKDHPSAEEARRMEIQLTMAAAGMGGPDEVAKAKERFEARLKEKGLTDSQKFDYRIGLLQVSDLKDEGFVQAVLQLAKDFPKHPALPQILFTAAMQTDSAHAAPLLEALSKNEQADPALRERVTGMLETLKLVGKPLELKMTTLDGKEIDIRKMKGKVVLIDFWATWCPPCVASIPEEKELYAKLKDQGFEIVGISLDDDLDALKTFLKEQGVTWPQVADGKRMDGELAKRFGIVATPTRWLIDKKGILRDLNARGGMEEKIKALLAEK